MTRYEISPSDSNNLKNWTRIGRDLIQISKAPWPYQFDECTARIKRARLQRPEGRLLVETQALSLIDNERSIHHFAARMPALRADVLALDKPKGWVDYVLFAASSILANHLVRLEVDYDRQGWFDRHTPRLQVWTDNMAAIESKDLRIDAYHSLLFISGDAPDMRTLAAKKMFSELLNVPPKRHEKELCWMLPLLPPKSEQAKHARKLLEMLKR